VICRFLTALILIAASVTAQINLTAPGVEGMISNADLRPGQMRYCLNIDAWSRPGFLQRRQGLQHYGATQRSVTGFHAMFDPYWNRKLVVGVSDSLYTYYNSGQVVANVVGQLLVSDTFRTEVVNGVAGYSFPHQDAHHDWTVSDLGLIHCDGKTLPMLLTMTSLFKHNDSTQDTVGYGPRVLPLGLPAPGQLLAGNSGIGGPLIGDYVYAYAFLDTATASGDSTGPLGIQSAPVSLVGQCAYLTQFDKYVHDTGAAGDMGPLIIARRRVGSRDEWAVIDTLFLAGPPYARRVFAYSVKKTWMNNPHDEQDYDNTHAYSIALADWDFLEGDSVWDSILVDFSAGDTIGSQCTDCYAGQHSRDSLTTYMTELFNDMPITGDSIIAIKSGYSVVIYNGENKEDSFSVHGDNVATSPGGYSYPYYYGPVRMTYDSVGATSPPLIYLDTMSDTPVVLFDASRVSDAIHAPGQLFADSLAAGYGTLDGYHAYDDSTYYVAYSYYDPLTGLESPRGPILAVELVDGLSGDTAQFRSLTTGVPASGRPTWIRFQQTACQSTIFGAGDTLIWYALYDIRTEGTSQTIVWGGWPDYAVASNLSPDSIKTDTLYDYQMAWNAAGDQISHRVWDNQLMFEDIAWCYGRFWGIYQNRLYYSGINDPADWSPYEFLRIDEGVDDELVAVREVGGQLYVFKHRSIWTVTGSDPQYDMYVEPYLTGIGVASIKAMRNHRADLYFLTPDAQFWSLRQGELSGLVADRMDSLFDISGIGTYRKVVDYGRVVPFNDKIMVVNDSTSEELVYQIDPGVWVPEVYSSFTPMGSFYYDSSQTISGFGSSHILWDSAGKPLMREYVSDTVRQDQSGTTAFAAEFYLGGDGQRYWQATALGIELKADHDRNWLRYSLRDQDSELATDSLYIKLKDTWRLLNWSLSPEQGTDLYLRLYSPAADSVNYYLHGSPGPGDSTLTTKVCRNAFVIDRLRVGLRDMGKPIQVGTGDDVDEEVGGGS